jgi:hypothetical protein
MVKEKLVEGIELDSELQPEFCNACVKAKSNVRPFPKESETQLKVYGEFVHWDLWDQLQSEAYKAIHTAARIDDASSKERLYFQQKKSQVMQSYLKDEAYLKNQTGKCIGTIHIN